MCSIVVVSMVVLFIIANYQSVCLYRELYLPSNDANNDFNNNVFINRIQLSKYDINTLLNRTYINGVCIFDIFHPVGSLFMTLTGYTTEPPTSVVNINTYIFPNTKWEIIPENLYLKTTTDDNKVGTMDTTSDIGKQYVSTDYINYTSTPNKQQGTGMSSINIFDDKEAKTITKTEPGYHTVYIWKRLPNDENEDENKTINIQTNNINLVNPDIIQMLINRMYPIGTVLINVSDATMNNIIKLCPSITWLKFNDVFIKTTTNYESKTNKTGGSNNIDIPDIVPPKWPSQYDWPNEKATERQHIIINNKDDTNTDNRPKFINCNIWYRSS